MSDITFSNFKLGLDTRRSILTTQPGALAQCQDAFINDGAEVEKRRAFLNASYAGQTIATSGTLTIGFTYTISIFVAGDSFTNVGAASNASGVTFVATGTTPTTWTNGSTLVTSNTFGLETIATGLVTFGSGADPGGWTNNVSYQRLQHPAVTDGATYNAAYHKLVSVNCSTSFGGAAWVAATFTDGKTYVFWNGSYVPAFKNGIILNGLDTATIGDNSLIAKQLHDYIAGLNLTGYLVSAITTAGLSSYFYVYAPEGQQVTFTVNKTSTSGTLVPTQISLGYQSVVGVAANSSFTIVAGSSGTITSVTTSDDGYTTNLLQGIISLTTTLPQLAIDTSVSIATNPSNLVKFTSVANQSTVILTDKTNSGTTLNGKHLKVIVTGDLCLDNIPLNFNSAWAAADNVTSIKWDTAGANTEILGSTITYQDVGHPGETLLQYVGRIAAAIRAFNASYTAIAVAGTTPANSVNLYVSRTTVTSAVNVATLTTGIFFTSGAGTVTNGLSGGTTTTPGTIVATISPVNYTFPKISGGGIQNQTFVVTITGGTAPYSWSGTLTQAIPSGVAYDSFSFVTSAGLATTGQFQFQVKEIQGYGAQAIPGNPSANNASLTMNIVDSLGNLGTVSTTIKGL